MLAQPTDPAWVPLVLSRLDEVLADHAHCEKKAASTAIAMIFRYQARPELMAPLSALAREELEHFERCLRILDDRGIAFGPQVPSPYAARLREACRVEEPARLLDTLLCCALIEARSCERMKILSEGLPDAELRAFYRDLLASEARHHTLYVDLAERFFPRDEVRARLADLALHEAAVLSEPSLQIRLHA